MAASPPFQSTKVGESLIENAAVNGNLKSITFDTPKQNLRGLNKPKCSKCGNVARSREGAIRSKYEYKRANEGIWNDEEALAKTYKPCMEKHNRLHDNASKCKCKSTNVCKHQHDRASKRTPVRRSLKENTRPYVLPKACPCVSQHAHVFFPASPPSWKLQQRMCPRMPYSYLHYSDSFRKFSPLFRQFHIVTINARPCVSMHDHAFYHFIYILGILISRSGMG